MLLWRFQRGCVNWAIGCFGRTVATNHVERNYRFLEEALELTQSLGLTKADALRLVDYVYERPAGLPTQEVGGTMVTLALLCEANEMDLQKAAADELDRCVHKEVQIREKHRKKTIRIAIPEDEP